MLQWVAISHLLLLLPMTGEGIWFLLSLKRWIPSSLFKPKRKPSFGLVNLLFFMGSLLWLLSLIVKNMFMLRIELGSARGKYSLLFWNFWTLWVVLIVGVCIGLGVMPIELPMLLLSGFFTICPGALWIFVMAPRLLFPYVIRNFQVLSFIEYFLLLIIIKKKVRKHSLTKKWQGDIYTIISKHIGAQYHELILECFALV